MTAQCSETTVTHDFGNTYEDTPMLATSSFRPTLMIREASRRARPATRDEVLAALGCMDYAGAIGADIGSPRQCVAFLRERCARLPYEVFGMVYLSNRHRVIAVQELFQGTIDGASVHPREVVKAALSHNAAAVVLFHNHPSGVPEPSHADEMITARLRDALNLVEICLLDHIIIAGDKHTSLAERGII
jgi:DNA repair protein RadC